MTRTIPIMFRGAMLLALGLLCQTATHATVLYDGSGGTTPNDPAWGWTYFPPIPGIMSATGGGTQLLSLTPLSTSVGFLRNDLVLNRNIGYTFKFNVRIDSEAVESGVDDRAGFSVIALSSDLRGIELAFWGNKIFAQSDSPLFTNAEESLVNTQQLREYLLTIQGNSYSLNWTGGSLSGDLRNYSAHPSAVYRTQNFLFLGDDTSSAGANIFLGNIEFQAIPEPGTLFILIAGVVILGIIWRVRKTKAKANLLINEHTDRLPAAVNSVCSSPIQAVN